MKVGILTFHRPINYGAFLQSFSLQSNLMNELENVNVEIVDYIAPKERKKIFLNVLRTVKYSGVINGFRDLSKIKSFHKSYRHLKLSERIFTKDLRKLYEFIDSNYDLLIIGSDAVFNWNQNGFPTAFIPYHQFKHCRVVTYAASVHGLKYLEESKARIDLCKKAFSEMDFIGVRDSCTESFVKYCLPNSEPHHCCDPTVVIDVGRIKKLSASFLNRIKKKHRCDLTHKFIVLMLPDGEVSKRIYETYSKEYQIVTIFKPSKDADFYLYDLDPFEWASVLSMASLVVTSYFHGTLLSLKQYVPVIVVDYSNYSGPYEGKLKDLMVRRLSLPELYYESNAVEGEEALNTLLLAAGKALNGDYHEKIKESMTQESSYFDKFVEYIKQTEGRC